MNTYTSHTVKLEGIEELCAMLRVAICYHKEEDVRKALSKGGEIIIKEAQSRAPVGGKKHSRFDKNGNKINYHPGNLRASIKVLPKWKVDPMAVYVGPKVKRVSRRQGLSLAKNLGIGVDAYYANFVEYGTAAHNIGFQGKHIGVKGADVKGQKPQPFMRPAYDSKGQAALNISMEEVWKLIEKNCDRATISNIAAHGQSGKRGGRRLY